MEFLLQFPHDTPGYPPLPGRDQLAIQISGVDGCAKPQEPDVRLCSVDAQFWIFSTHIIDQGSQPFKPSILLWFRGISAMIDLQY